MSARLIDDTTEVTARELAGLLGLGERRVQQLAADGVLVRSARGRYRLGESIRSLLAAAEGQAEPDDLRRARLELMQAQTRRIEQDIAEREAQAGDLDWQAGLLSAYSTFLALRLRNAGAWFVSEFGNRYPTVRGIQGDATRELAGWCQETMLGLVAEAQTELSAIVADAQRRNVILDWPAMVGYAERDDIADEPADAKVH